MNENETPVLRFYNNFPRVITIIAGIVLAVGTVVIAVGYASSGFAILIFGCVLAVLGVIGSLFGLYQVASSKPYLEITSGGVRIRQRESAEIDWSEIRGSEIVERHGMVFLILQLASSDTISNSKVLSDFKTCWCGPTLKM